MRKSIQSSKNSWNKGPDAGACLEYVGPVWLEQRERDWWEVRKGVGVRMVPGLTALGFCSEWEATLEGAE